MFSGLLDQVTSVLERRFLKNAFLPVLVFFPAVVTPLLLYSGRLDDIAARWEQESLSVRVLEVVGYLSVVWFLAAIVASQWRNIIRLFEGYPLRQRAPRLAQRSAEWHRRRREYLVARGHPAMAWYPRPRPEDINPTMPDELLPTQLGNLLRAAERYPYYRYRADLIVLWPRLYRVMPREEVADVEDTRATLEFLLVVTLWLVAFAWTNLVLLSGSDAPIGLVLGCFFGPLALAYLAYLSALRAGDEYGVQLQASFDLHRLELLQRMKVATPGDLTRERDSWRRMTGFLRSGSIGRAWRWEYADPPPPQLLVGAAPPTTGGEGSDRSGG